MAEDPALATGVNVIGRPVTYEPVAEAVGMEYTPLVEVLPLQAHGAQRKSQRRGAKTAVRGAYLRQKLADFLTHLAARAAAPRRTPSRPTAAT